MRPLQRGTAPYPDVAAQTGMSMEQTYAQEGGQERAPQGPTVIKGGGVPLGLGDMQGGCGGRAPRGVVVAEK